MDYSQRFGKIIIPIPNVRRVFYEKTNNGNNKNERI